MLMRATGQAMQDQPDIQIYQSNTVGSSSDKNALQLTSSSVHYAIAAIVFAIYGIQVCPFLEALTLTHLVVPIILALIGRHLLLNPIVLRPSGSQAPKQFSLDIGLFMGAALGLVLVNSLFFDAPWHSNVKVCVGMGIIGLFVAVDLALARERFFALALINQNRELDLSRRFTSFAQKFMMMASVMVVSTSLVLFLVVNKDLEWLLAQGNNITPENARNSILFEVAFVMVILLAYCIRIIHSYVKNLKMYLAHQNGVLSEVLHGNFLVKVPVTSQDEFGVMATGTNAMIESLRQHHAELQQTRDVSILALASLAETRDNETGAHILRTQRYVKALALRLKDHPDFRAELTIEAIDLLFKSAPLHDVGKVGIPDNILLKPGKLTDEEFAVMKQHAQLGADALLVAESQLGSNSFLRLAREIAACHHEKWNGSGYPLGTKGDAIPLSARLMALADVYDALISKRVYKPAFSHDKAKGIILEGDGSHFDPRVVKAFLDCEDEFKQIALEFKDGSD